MDRISPLEIATVPIASAIEHRYQSEELHIDQKEFGCMETRELLFDLYARVDEYGELGEAPGFFRDPPQYVVPDGICQIEEKL